MSELYVGLGSNLGDRANYLDKAIAEIQSCIGTITKRSEYYSTEPWGYDSPRPYLNACVCVETTLHWLECLELTQEIEKKLGRRLKTTAHYQDREIDIDLLLYDQLILNEPTLVLPHPFMHKRRFVLLPLSRIAPDLQHPVLKQSIQELYLALDT